MEPYAQNNWYWQHDWGDGLKPVMLIGGSGADNPFQWAGANFERALIDKLDLLDWEPGKNVLDCHLDLLQSVGGNWIRNALFSRFSYNQTGAFYPIEYEQAWEFEKDADGTYDLNRFSRAYFDRLRRFLDATKQRRIFVGLEMADYQYWAQDPFNPHNNCNYTWADCTGLRELYAKHARPGYDQPGGRHQGYRACPYWAVPPLFDDPVVRPYIEARYRKILDLTLQYDHVLYHLKNESCCPVEISDWWCDFIHDYARSKGKRVFVTENRWLHGKRTYSYGRDDQFMDMKHIEVRHAIEDPDRYDFIDQSNISGEIGQKFYDCVSWLRARTAEHKVRPINFLKNYWGHWFTCNEDYGNKDPRNKDEEWKTQESAARMWRALCAGVAGIRFHRNAHVYGCSGGVGLSPAGQTHIRSLRMFSDALDLFRMEPHNELIAEASRVEDEAYCLAEPGKQYAVYFKGEAGDNSVALDLGAVPESASISAQWLDITNCEWLPPEQIPAAKSCTLTVPGQGLHWAVVLSAD